MIGERAKMILIVSDDALTAASERAALEEFGYATAVARDAQEAVCLYESMHPVDLVLMDVDLGAATNEIDGIDTARILQGERPVPVVFTFSSTDRDVLSRMELVDSYGFVSKDSSDAAIAASIAIAFRRRTAERKAREDCLRKMLAAIPDIISINSPEAVCAL